MGMIEDTVREIDEKTTDGRVGVLFWFHAAYYFLPRDEPHFAEWLAILQESQRRNVPVRVTYDIVHDRFAGVELLSK